MRTDDALAILARDTPEGWALALCRVVPTSVGPEYQRGGWIMIARRNLPTTVIRAAWGNTPEAATNALLDGRLISNVPEVLP
jgi:hypothetical protein